MIEENSSKPTLERANNVNETKHSTYPCVMNSKLIFNKDESYLSYTCTTCPGKPDNICYLCMQTCHKNHITNWKNVKERRLNIKSTPCSCALKDHRVSKQYTRFDEIRTDTNEMQCTLNEVIFESNIKHFYIDPISHMYYCLYCLDACQGVLEEALEDYIKREKSKFSQGAPLCSCSNKDSHSPFHENIVSLANFILSPVYDKVINRVQLPGQMYSKPALCEKYLDPIKIAHSTISKDLKEKNFDKYNAETLSKSYVSCLQLLRSSAEILKKDTNLITNPNIQVIYNIEFLLEIFSSNFYEDFSLIDTKIYTLYFFRKFYLLPMINYKKWHDGYTDFDNVTPFHRLIFRADIKEFFKLSKVKRNVFNRLLDKIHIYIFKYFGKIDEGQFSQLVIEYLKWIILIISYKFDRTDKESKKMFTDVLSKFFQLVDLVAPRKSLENVLKKYFEIMITKIMLQTNDEILWDKIIKKPSNHDLGRDRGLQHDFSDKSLEPLKDNKQDNNIKQTQNYMELQEEEECDQGDMNPDITPGANYNSNYHIDDDEDEEHKTSQDKNSKPKEKKFMFESGEFQVNLLKALFAFGKDERDVSKEIKTGEIYDMLVNENDYYYEGIQNFTNSKFCKENLDILILLNGDLSKIELSQEEEKYISLIKGRIEFLVNTKKKFYEANINEKEIIECTINIFQVTLKYLASIILTDFVSNSDDNSEEELERIRKNNFKIQIYLFKIGFFDLLLNMWYVLTSNDYIANVVEAPYLNSSLSEILKNFYFLCYDNAFLTSFMFNKHILNVLFEFKYDEERDYLVKAFYLDVLKIVSKTKLRLNFLHFLELLDVNFDVDKLTETEIYRKKRREFDFEERKIIAQLSIYKKVIKNTNLKSLPTINNSVGYNITRLLSSSYYSSKMDDFKKNFEVPSDMTIKFLSGVFKNLNSLEDTYFSIMTDYININDVEILLSQNLLDPIARRIFTITYSKFYAECPFKIWELLDKKGMKKFRKDVDFNLIGKFLILDEEFETEKANLNNTSFFLDLQTLKRPFDNESINYQTLLNPDSAFLPLITNMEKYRRLVKVYSEDFFKSKLRFFVKYFTDVILFPSIFSIYKILYYSSRASAKYKYLSYRFIYLFMLCYKHFLSCITNNKSLNLIGMAKKHSMENLAFLTSYFNFKRRKGVNSIVDFMFNVMEELNSDINYFKSETFEPLKLEIVMEKWKKYVRHFSMVKCVLDRKEFYVEENEDDVDQNFDSNEKIFDEVEKKSEVFDAVQKFLEEYKERKLNLEKNVLFCLYEESTTEQIRKETLKKTIAMDLLFRLQGRQLQDNEEESGINNNSSSLMMNTAHPHSSNFQTNYITDLRKSGSVEMVKGLLQNVFGYAIPKEPVESQNFISIFNEENSNLLETINKLFKANPDLWQKFITESCTVMKKKIFDIVRQELTYILQLIFVKFHKLSRSSSDVNSEYANQIFDFEKTYLLRIIEFFRLFCENHHSIYQTFFTHLYIQHKELNLIDFILEIPVAVLSHTDYFKKKKMRGILKYFREDESDYFNDLLDSTYGFLVELIQGSFADNFNFIASRKEFFIFYEYAYRFFDSIDSGEDSEKFTANFMKFINCFLEENTNSVENKTTIVKKFKPSKLLSVLLFSFKKLCYIYLVEKKKGNFDNVENIKVDSQTIHSYNVPDSASKELLKIFIQDESIRNHHLFNLVSSIFIFFKSATLFKSGEKIKTLLTNLQKLSEMDAEKIPEKNKHLIIIKREVYNFLNSIVKEVEVSYKVSKKMEDIELIKYREYFDEDFFEFEKFKKYLKTELQGIQNVIYVVHPDSLFIEPQDLDKFNEIAPFENFNIKLNFILEYYETLYSFLQLRKVLLEKNSKFLYFLFYLDYHQASIISICITLFVNGLIVLISLFADKKVPIDLATQIFNSSTENHGMLPYPNHPALNSKQNESSLLIRDYGSIAVNLISSFHLVLLLLVILNFMAFNVYRINSFIYNRKQISFSAKIKSYAELLFEKDIFPLVWIYVFGLFALLDENYKFAYSLQLLAIFQKVPTMQTVIYSVVIRYKQFVSATFLIIILMLFYSSIAFYLFRDEYYNSDIEENTCSTFLKCFLYLITNGIRGGAGLGFPIKSIKDRKYFFEFIFEWIFYFSIMLIMLNVINGIIVDTFQALREQNNLKEDIRENVCYICSLNRSRFEIKGVSFSNHVDVEHNVLNYFYYITKVQMTDEQELNSLDYDVLNCIRQLRTDFFPIKKALSLANDNKDEK